MISSNLFLLHFTITFSLFTLVSNRFFPDYKKLEQEARWRKMKETQKEDNSNKGPLDFNGSQCLTRKLEFGLFKINRDLLVDILKNCSEIEEIHLDAVDWKWNEGLLNKAHTPNLKKYFLSMYRGKLFDSEKHSELIIPFYKFERDIGAFSELKYIDFSIRVYYTVAEGPYLTMRNGELNIRNFNYSTIFWWLRNILHLFQRVSIKDSHIYSQDANFTAATDLYFENITFHGSVSELLKTAKNLKKIEFVGEVQVKKLGWVSPIQILNDTFQNVSLTVLTLRNAKVIRNDIIELLNKCHELIELKLYKIVWEWDKKSYAKSHLPLLNTFRIELQEDSSTYMKTLEDFQSLILLYKSNSTEQQLALKNLTYFVDANFANGKIEISTKNILITNIKEFDISNAIYGLTKQADYVSIHGCTIKAENFKLTNARTIELVENKIIGSISVILKSATHGERITVTLKEDEAIDIAVLPNQYLIEFKTSKLSLRWSSAGPISFPVLNRLALDKGDIDLTLFKKTKDYLELQLTDFFLWNSGLSVNDFQLYRFQVECRFKRYCQTLDLCNIPSTKMNSIKLVNVEVTLKNCTKSFFNLYELSINNVKFDVKDNLSKIFPNVRYVILRLGNLEHSLSLLPTLFYIGDYKLCIEIINDMNPFEISVLKHNLNPWTNIDVNNFRGRGTILEFAKTQNGWIPYDNKFKVIEEDHRKFDDILKKFESDGTEIGEKTLNTIIQSYPIIIYTICSFGILLNCMSAVVLFKKSMRSSTSYIMISLTFCDTLFLVACLLTTSEFRLLFIPGYNKNYVISNIVYPLQKIGYSGSIYMTILITIERFIATCYPLLCKSIFTKRKTFHYILTAMVLSNILNITRWIENIELNYEARSPIWSNWNPKQLHKYKIYEYLYLKFICYTFTYVIPSVSIIVMNSLIAKKAREARQDRQRFRGLKQNNDDNSLTRVLLTVVVVFFICNSVSCIINWIFISHNVEPEIGETFGILPIIINSSVNFILYYLMGTKFRNEFKATWIKSFKFLRKQGNQLEDSQTTPNTIPLSNI